MRSHLPAQSAKCAHVLYLKSHKHALFTCMTCSHASVFVRTSLFGLVLFFEAQNKFCLRAFFRMTAHTHHTRSGSVTDLIQARPPAWVLCARREIMDQKGRIHQQPRHARHAPVPHSPVEAPLNASTAAGAPRALAVPRLAATCTCFQPGRFRPARAWC